MKKSSREINVFSVSALDLFASALGAFIVMSMIFMVFFTMTSRDTSDDLQPALEQCEAERARVDAALTQAQAELAQAEAELAQCRSELAGTVDASALEQCRSDLEQATGRADRTGEDLAGCQQELRRTFVLILASWTTIDDMDLHIVDPSGREFYYADRRHGGSPAVFEEDNTRGPGNEVWLHPRAEEGRYRVCYKLFNHRSGSQVSVRGSVLWKDGSIRIGEVGLGSDDEVRLSVEFVVDSQGNVTMDPSRTGRFLGRGGCAS